MAGRISGDDLALVTTDPPVPLPEFVDKIGLAA